LFFAMMLFFSACRWRRFEPEFLVSNVTAGIRNPSANSERCETENKRRCCERRRSARPLDRHNHSSDCQSCENIKRVNQFLTALHVLVEPLFARPIGHRFYPVVSGLA